MAGKGVAGACGKLPPADGVDVAGARRVQWEAEVCEGHDVLLEPVTPVVVRLRSRVALHDHAALVVDGVRKARHAGFERIGPGPVGRLAVEELAEEGERPAAPP